MRRFLEHHITHRVGLMVVGMLLVGVVVSFGVHSNRVSQAATGAVLSFKTNLNDSKIPVGSVLTAAIISDSQVIPVRTVETSLRYDPVIWQYIGTLDSGDMPVASTTSSAVPGVIRLKRSVGPRSAVSGRFTVASVRLKALSTATMTSIAFDSAQSFVTTAGDGSNILTNQMPLELTVVPQ